jgi:hypothetical protein
MQAGLRCRRTRPCGRCRAPSTVTSDRRRLDCFLALSSKVLEPGDGCAFNHWLRCNPDCVSDGRSDIDQRDERTIGHRARPRHLPITETADAQPRDKAKNVDFRAKGLYRVIQGLNTSSFGGGRDLASRRFGYSPMRTRIVACRSAASSRMTRPFRQTLRDRGFTTIVDRRYLHDEFGACRAQSERRRPR